MSIILIILGAGLILFIIAAIAGSADSNRAGRKAAKILKTIDKKYNDYIEKRINLNILQKDQIDIEEVKLIEDTITILTPEIEALIAHINATIYSSVEVKHNSPYFENAVSLAEEYFRKTGKSETKNLSKKEADKLFASIKAGVTSDLKQRILNMKTLNF